MTFEAILVLRFSAVGDVVLTSPALEALKTALPKTRVIFATKARLGHLVRYNPNVDEVLPLQDGESPFSLASRARALGVDAVLDLHGKLRSKLVRAALPSARSAVWTKRDWRDTVPVKLGLRPYHPDRLMAERYHAAVEALVGRELPRGQLRYVPGPADRALAQAALQEQGADLTRPILGLSPGANWQTKRWPAERFGELAGLASAAGWQVATAAGPDERELASVMKTYAPDLIDLSGQLDLAGLGGFIASCSAFVANDSGPMHLARALGVPTLAFFGSTSPLVFAWQGHGLMFEAGLECAPCSFFGRRSCPKGHFRCMLDQSVEAAWAALQPLMDRKPRPFVSG
jgi:heptosyltransferase-2